MGVCNYEGILRICVYVYCLDRRRALVSAISSACCDVVPCGKGLASRTVDDVTTAYPACLFP